MLFGCFCGIIVSEFNEYSKSTFFLFPGPIVDAPIINGRPISMSCKLLIDTGSRLVSDFMLSARYTFSRRYMANRESSRINSRATSMPIIRMLNSIALPCSIRARPDKDMRCGFSREKEMGTSTEFHSAVGDVRA
jgi:hypothetical protein